MEDKIIEKLKLKIAISEIKRENDIAMNKRKMIINKKIGIAACACLVLTTSVAFAKDIDNYLKKLFNNSNIAIDMAVQNGYVQQENMDYTYDKGIGIKVDSIVLDDLNLDISFYFETKKENVKSIRFNEFIITNDNEKTIYQSEFNPVENDEELPLYNTVTWGNEPIRLTNTTFADSILFGLRPEKEDFKELYFDIKKIDIVYTDNRKEIIDGTWKFNVKINDEMRKSSTIIYNMDGNNEFIESCSATISNTGTLLELTSKVAIPTDIYAIPSAPEKIYLNIKSKNKTYRAGFTDYNEERMDIHFDDIGIYDVENVSYLELYIGFFDTTLYLVREDLIEYNN